MLIILSAETKPAIMGNSASAAAPVVGAPAEPPQPSYYEMVKQGYADLVQAIIRPPRCRYETHTTQFRLL